MATGDGVEPVPGTELIGAGILHHEDILMPYAMHALTVYAGLIGIDYARNIRI